MSQYYTSICPATTHQNDNHCLLKTENFCSYTYLFAGSVRIGVAGLLINGSWGPNVEESMVLGRLVPEGFLVFFFFSLCFFFLWDSLSFLLCLLFACISENNESLRCYIINTSE